MVRLLSQLMTSHRIASWQEVIDDAVGRLSALLESSWEKSAIGPWLAR